MTEDDVTDEAGDEKMECDSDGSDDGKNATKPALSPDDFDNILSNNVDIFISKLYSKPGYPRNLVDTVVKDITDFLSGDFLKNLQDLCLQNLDKEVPESVRLQVIEMFQKLSNPFENMSTEYKRFKHFQTLGTYIAPQTYRIDSRVENVKGVPQMRDVTGTFVPLRKFFEKNFELPDV